MHVRELKFGKSWVRGVVGDALHPELIVNFACAFGTWCGGETVVIGRDPRKSSPMLRSAVVAGLLSCGTEVIDLGICTSPLISFAVRDLGAAGGISITGSHNDIRWNALKFYGSDGVLLNAAKSEELLDLYHASSFLSVDSRRIRPVATAPDVAERYLHHLLSPLNIPLLRERRFTVAMDFCNGSCAPIAKLFLEKIGCRLLPMNEDPTGEFAHPPAPNPTNMRQLSSLLRYIPTDLGAAINVDGDRLGLVTSTGEGLSEEIVLPLTALHRLRHRPGPVVTNLSTSHMIDAVAKRYNQEVLRDEIGEGAVMDRGLAESAVLAGEGGGGVAALPVSMTFDGLLSLGIILEAMAEQNCDLSSLVKELPKLSIRKGSLACPPDVIPRVLDGFRKYYFYQNINTVDGVLVQWDDAWLHVRASNTEPILRIIVETPHPEHTDRLFREAFHFARRSAFQPGE